MKINLIRVYYMATLSAEREIGPPWGAIVIVDAHGEKLEKKISGNGVLVNQGNDFFGNFVSIPSAKRIKAEIFESKPLEFYKDILKREKKKQLMILIWEEINHLK